MTTGAWCYYNNDPANGPIYGKLYNWYAVNDPRGLVPIGWHMPSSAEWNTVVDFLGGQAVAGIKMKTTTGWSLVPGFVSTNSSGFTGLPGGSRANEGTFYSIVANAYWWSSTSCFTDIAWMNYIGNNFDESYVSLRYKTNGLSVRCVKD